MVLLADVYPFYTFSVLSALIDLRYSFNQPELKRGNIMLILAVFFFIFLTASVVFGFGWFYVGFAWIFRILFWVFLIGLIVSLIVGITNRGKPKTPGT